MARQLKSVKVDRAEAEAAMNDEQKVTGVTATNMRDKHRLYAMIHHDPGVMGKNLNPIEHASEWGAWRSYFKDKGMAVHFMDQQGQRLASMSKEARAKMCGYLVPCSFPGDFDAEWATENDRYAADKFVAAQAKKREEVKSIEGIDKQAVVRAALVKRAEG